MSEEKSTNTEFTYTWYTPDCKKTLSKQKYQDNHKLYNFIESWEDWRSMHIIMIIMAFYDCRSAAQSGMPFQR